MTHLLKRLLGAAALSATLFAATAGATTLLALDVAGLTRSSDLVVRGVVTRVEPHWSQDHARIFTDAEIQVVEVWKGGAVTTLTAMQPGGEIGDVGQRVHGVATFFAGEPVVLFLEKRGPRYTVTGMAQGKFRLEPNTDGTVMARTSPDADLALIDPVTHQAFSRPPLSLPVDELKAQVKAAVVTLPAPDDKTNPRLPTVTP